MSDPHETDDDARLSLAVCELPDGLVPGDPAWRSLLERVADMRPQALLLNELPFGRWPAEAAMYDTRRAGQVVADHAAGIASLDDFGLPIVFGSTARSGTDALINEGFVRTAKRYHALHHKLCLPEEPGFYEDSWFRPGTLSFQLFDYRGFRFAFAICSELMVPEVSRTLVRAGADVLLVPRASTAGGLERWLLVARATALMNGCYVASSNRRSGGEGNGPDFGGCGFIIGPDGEILIVTDTDRPLAAALLSRQVLRKARRCYPMTIRAHLDFAAPRPL